MELLELMVSRIVVKNEAPGPPRPHAWIFLGFSLGSYRPRLRILLSEANMILGPVRGHSARYLLPVIKNGHSGSCNTVLK